MNEENPDKLWSLSEQLVAQLFEVKSIDRDRFSNLGRIVE